MSMQQYENYKDTGNTWLGRVPSSWEVRRADFVIKSQKFQVGPSDLEDVDVYHYAIPTVQSTGAGAIEEGESIDSGKLIINEPQVLVSKLNPRKATVTIADPHAEYLTVASTEFVPLIPYDADLRYIFYTWKSEKVTKRLSSFVQSVTRSHQRCDPADITKIPWAWPSLNEQQKIATFLDRKTAEIDALIDKKRRLLNRLAEKRTALITSAVTKGLNPDAPMKDSGIEWLGEIPTHWDVMAIKWITPVLRGASPRPIDDPIYFDDDGEYSWVRIADVTASEVCLEKTTQRLSELGASLSVKRHPGDLFLSIAGSVGKPIITGIKCCIHDGFVYFPRIPHELSEYLFWIFKSGQPYLGLGKLGTQLNLNTDTVGGIRIAVPPTDEANEIVEWISHSVKSLDEIHERIGNAIALLEEYRSALITNAVTGQIKVS